MVAGGNSHSRMQFIWGWMLACQTIPTNRKSRYANLKESREDRLTKMRKTSCIPVFSVRIYRSVKFHFHQIHNIFQCWTCSIASRTYSTNNTDERLATMSSPEGITCAPIMITCLLPGLRKTSYTATRSFNLDDIVVSVFHVWISQLTCPSAPSRDE